MNKQERKRGIGASTGGSLHGSKRSVGRSQGEQQVHPRKGKIKGGMKKNRGCRADMAEKDAKNVATRTSDGNSPSERRKIKREGR